MSGNIIKSIKPTDCQFRGATIVSPNLLFPGGSCINWLPPSESQIGKYFDTYGCVSYSFNHCAETIMNRMIDLNRFSATNIKWLNDNGYFISGKVRFSDRWLIVRSGTDPQLGNSGQTVADYARSKGLAPLSLCDWDLNNIDPVADTKAAYYNASTINSNADKVAAQFSQKFDILYEWVDISLLQQASQEGAVQVYTNAWFEDSIGKYYNPDPGTKDHAIEFCDYPSISIFDQYNPWIKQMATYEDIYYNCLKININQKPMNKPNIKNNTLVQLISAPGGFGLYLDGNIIIDDTAKVLASWLVRNNGNIGGMVMPLVTEQWAMFPHVNLKMQTVQ